MSNNDKRTPSTLTRMNKPLVRCRCRKVFSATEHEARRVKKNVEKHKDATTDKVRFYQCRYGGWHWTTELHEVRECTNCKGRFRPRNDQSGKMTACDTCQKILDRERSLRHLEKQRREAAIRAAEEARHRMQAQRVAQILQHPPTPGDLFPRKRTA